MAPIGNRPSWSLSRRASACADAIARSRRRPTYRPEAQKGRLQSVQAARQPAGRFCRKSAFLVAFAPGVGLRRRYCQKSAEADLQAGGPERPTSVGAGGAATCGQILPEIGLPGRFRAGRRPAPTPPPEVGGGRLTGRRPRKADFSRCRRRGNLRADSAGNRPSWSLSRRASARADAASRSRRRPTHRPEAQKGRLQSVQETVTQAERKEER